MRKERMAGLRSYQDILTPEEMEERDRRIWEKQRRDQEIAELRAEEERDRLHEEED